MPLMYEPHKVTDQSVGRNCWTGRFSLSILAYIALEIFLHFLERLGLNFQTKQVRTTEVISGTK